MLEEDKEVCYEMFMTLNRLKLGLLGQDLAERFALKQNVVSQIVCTWID